MGTVYASPPQQVVLASASPDPAEDQLVADMNALQSLDGDKGFVPSHWMAAPTAGDESENYTLHSSPAVSSLQHASSSNSSPRSWDSPEQLGFTPWEAATERLHDGRHHGLDSQMPAYLQDHTIPATSFPSDAVGFLPTLSFEEADSAHQRARSQTEPCPISYHPSPHDGYASTPESGHPLTPCSPTLTLPMNESAASPPAGEDASLAALGDDERRDAANALLSGADSGNGKDGPSYAKLIYRAFLSTPRHAMTLQEIYQWFRENTDKGKSESKGWQNSVRHNLSMNLAFVKRERKLSMSKDGKTTPGARRGAQSGAQSGDSTKKSTEWCLEPWAVAGVQSTTRYRKDNQSRRSAARHGGALSSRGYRSYPAQHHHHHSFSSGGARRSGSTGIIGGGITSPSSRRTRQTAAGGIANALRTVAANHHNAHHPSHLHHHHAHFPYPAHHLSPSTSPYSSPFFPHHHLTTAPSTTSSATASPSATTTTIAAADAAASVEYDYADPALFPSLVRAASESAVEAHYTHHSHAHHHHHSHSQQQGYVQETHYTGYPSYAQQQPTQQYHAGVVPGVYHGEEEGHAQGWEEGYGQVY
ncbi:hypothetical protein C8A05DRAFT_36294 [Staphylotrichum tortipilum]|uniref:Fork-head domain-containing protein n=1 Tax=Staphylotrichum tortipilum TaxID=2831512 RepID=A0AAN6RS27_9PEZI|nr:hypothetical protein C8A05DRAFT_36294 [Staphylotrichum longicolle]